MDSQHLIPYLLLGTAILEVLVTPIVMLKVPAHKRLVVGFAMFSGALMTGGIGLAFWMGWIG